MKQSTAQKIKLVIEEQVNPVLAEHFGGAEFSDYEDGVVWIRMTGACGNCPSAKQTIEEVVKVKLQEQFPDIRDVQLDDSVDEDMLEMARKILRKQV